MVVVVEAMVVVVVEAVVLAVDSPYLLCSLSY